MTYLTLICKFLLFFQLLLEDDLRSSIIEDFKLSTEEIMELLSIARNYDVKRIQDTCSDLIELAALGGENGQELELTAEEVPVQELVEGLGGEVELDERVEGT